MSEGFLTRAIGRLKIRYRPVICPFPELIGFVRAGDSVCDVGCGSGQLLLMLKRRTYAKRMVGLELDTRLIDTAASLLESDPHAVPCDLQVFNGIDFPDRLRECNLVFLVDVLHHVPGDLQQHFLSRLYATLGGGARVIIKDINRASPLVLCNKLHDLVLTGATGRERSLREAQAMCERAGFRVISTFKRRQAVYPHYFLVLEKTPDAPVATDVSSLAAAS